jgi:excisionase family DNA binding protein
MTASTLPRLYKVSEAADKSGVSEWTVREEIKRGNLRARRIARLVRIVDDDLAVWMRGES